MGDLFGTEVETPDVSPQERELIDQLAETSRIQKQLALDGVRINRMLFPEAARAIGLEPIFAAPPQPSPGQDGISAPRAVSPPSAQVPQGISGIIDQAMIDQRVIVPTGQQEQAAQEQAEEGLLPPGTSMGDITGFRRVDTNVIPSTAIAPEQFKAMIQGEADIAAGTTRRATQIPKEQSERLRSRFRSSMGEFSGQSRQGFSEARGSPTEQAVNNMSPSQRKRLNKAIDDGDEDIIREILASLGVNNG